MDSERIPADLAASRMRALSSGGVGPGLPRKRRDQWILLRAAQVHAFPDPAQPLDEKSLGERLKAWLESLGPRVTLDHVSLRRALVDEGFVDRPADGATYRRSSAFERRVSFEEAS